MEMQEVRKKEDLKKQDDFITRQGEDVAVIAQKQLSRQYARFTSIAVLSVVIIISAIYFVSKEVKRVKAAKAEEQWATAGLNVIASLGADKDKAEKIVSDIEGRFPVPIDVPIKLIPAVKQFARASGIVSDPEIDVKGVGTGSSGSLGVDFEMKIDAPLTTLLSFLVSFEQAYLVSVSSWKITPLNANAYEILVDGVFFTR